MKFVEKSLTRLGKRTHVWKWGGNVQKILNEFEKRAYNSFLLHSQYYEQTSTKETWKGTVMRIHFLGSHTTGKVPTQLVNMYTSNKEGESKVEKRKDQKVITSLDKEIPLWVHKILRMRWEFLNRMKFLQNKESDQDQVHIQQTRRNSNKIHWELPR